MPGFPPVNSGGLIEAAMLYQRAWMLMHRAMFPPVNSGGLIEACRSSGVNWDGGLRRFRR